MPLALALPPLAVFLKFLIGALVVRALIALGIGIAVFVGFDTLFASLKDLIFQNFADANALFPIVIHFLGLLQVDVFINMVFSAYVIRLSLQAPNAILKRFFIG